MLCQPRECQQSQRRRLFRDYQRLGCQFTLLINVRSTSTGCLTETTESDDFFSFEPLRICQVQVQSLSIPSFGIADVTAEAGSSATLRCVLENDLSASSIEWHKSSSLDDSWPSEQIVQNNRIKISSESGSTFILKIVSVINKLELENISSKLI